MAEQALYRKYRSSDFTQVVGQDHIVKTLTTAITTGRLSHAYLFTGPRGVGKTSVARLLARALNCTGEPKPCNTCDNCLAAINSSLDIIEIDAASNNGVDDVRELRDKISLAPTTGKYKVYIIDEVHMLSSGAFNALLKTLEEPPAHAVFILATTEAHKLPETVVSRTQAFNFKPITVVDIVAQLAKIAKAEKIEIEPDALEIIARASRGGFRDAIGMLDQVASSGESPVTSVGVRALLGYSDSEMVASISRAFVAGDAKGTLTGIAQLIDQGAQPGQLALQLVDQWRAVLLEAAGAQESVDPVVTELAAATGAAKAAATLEILLDVTRSAWPQLSLEAALVRIAVANNEKLTGPVVPSLAPVAPKPTKLAQAPATEPEAPEPAANTIESAARVVSPDSLSTDLWPKVLVILKPQNNSLCALLQMYPADFGPDTITIRSRFNFHRDLFNKPANRQAIEAAASKVYGKKVNVTAVTDEAAKAAPSQRKSTSDLISSALEILGGEVID